MKLVFRKQMGLLLLVAGSALAFLIWGHAGEKRLNAASSTFTEMYHDRLVAEHLVYQMTELVHRQQFLNADRNKNHIERMETLSRELAVLTGKFAASKLSQDEKVIFNALKLKLQHTGMAGLRTTGNTKPVNTPAKEYTEALSLLGQLADIQVKEGTRLNTEGQISLASSAAGLKLQSALFVVFVLGLFALLKGVWIKSKVIQKHELN